MFVLVMMGRRGPADGLLFFGRKAYRRSRVGRRNDRNAHTAVGLSISLPTHFDVRIDPAAAISKSSFKISFYLNLY
jgi:hypothetical protein